MKAPRQLVQRGFGVLLLGMLTVVLVAALATMSQTSQPPNEAIQVAQPTRALLTPQAELTSALPGSTPTILVSPTPSVTPVGITQTPDLTLVVDTTAWPVYEDLEYGVRFQYPPNYVYASKGPSNEILRETIFYDPSAHQPGVSTNFDGIGFLILDNPQRFASIEEWADAHLFSTVGSVRYSLQFQSYEIVRKFNIKDNDAAEVVTISGVGITERSIIIMLDDKVAYFFNHTDRSSIHSFFQAMALTFEDAISSTLPSATPTASLTIASPITQLPTYRPPDS